MSRGTPAEQRADMSALVDQISALAEHARVHGTPSDCGHRMDALIAKHRARIEAARQDGTDADDGMDKSVELPLA